MFPLVTLQRGVNGQERFARVGGQRCGATISGTCWKRRGRFLRPSRSCGGRAEDLIRFEDATWKPRALRSATVERRCHPALDARLLSRRRDDGLNGGRRRGSPKPSTIHRRLRKCSWLPNLAALTLGFSPLRRLHRCFRVDPSESVLEAEAVSVAAVRAVDLVGR